MEKQMNENSLENLKKEKEKKKYGYRYQIPQETIDKLFAKLTEGVLLREAAKEVNICYDTAKKYFDHGDERRGLKPLKLRIQIFQDAVSKEFDSTLIERRKELIELTVIAINQIKEEIVNKNLLKKASYNTLANLARLEIWLRGGETVKHEKRLGILTAEDIRGAAAGEK